MDEFTKEDDAASGANIQTLTNILEAVRKKVTACHYQMNFPHLLYHKLPNRWKNSSLSTCLTIEKIVRLLVSVTPAKKEAATRSADFIGKRFMTQRKVTVSCDRSTSRPMSVMRLRGFGYKGKKSV